MKLNQLRSLEAAATRLEDARDRVSKVGADLEDDALIRLGKLLTLDLGAVRGTIKRLNLGE